MAAIGFYHLTRDSAETALPMLLDRTLASGERALVRLRDPGRLKAIDQALWQAPGVFLPHGSASDPACARHAALQPIWLAITAEKSGTETVDNPNDARFLFLLDGADVTTPDGFARVFDLFDGNDSAQVASARERWSARKAAGHSLSYFRQESGGWKRGG